MDIHFIRDNVDVVKTNQCNRFKDPALVDKILELDAQWKALKWKGDNMRKLKNGLSHHFKNAPLLVTVNIDESNVDEIVTEQLNSKDSNDNKFTRDQLKMLGTRISQLIETNETETKKLCMERDNLIAELPNFTHSGCVVSNDEANNGLIFEHNSAITFPDNLSDHIDLLEKLGFTDTENGIKVAGNRGYFLTGFGVRLNQAIINYALDCLEKANYKLMETPHMVTRELMGKISQLSDYDETLYKLEGHDKYLIATSEQPLTAFFSDKIFSNTDLPIKFGGLSSCYRKEAGAHARHTRGIYRVHQFQKVEQFCVTEPEKSWEMFESMMQVSKDFYVSLGLKFRVVNIVSGALNNAASMKYDLEAYFPGSKEWCELVSCTNVLDYFSKRINLKNTKQTHLHMLNCTLTANTRTLCALVETHQTENGMNIPEVLRPYLGGKDFVPFIKK